MYIIIKNINQGDIYNPISSIENGRNYHLQQRNVQGILFPMLFFLFNALHKHSKIYIAAIYLLIIFPLLTRHTTTSHNSDFGRSQSSFFRSVKTNGIVCHDKTILRHDEHSVGYGVVHAVLQLCYTHGLIRASFPLWSGEALILSYVADSAEESVVLRIKVLRPNVIQIPATETKKSGNILFIAFWVLMSCSFIYMMPTRLY